MIMVPGFGRHNPCDRMVFDAGRLMTQVLGVYKGILSESLRLDVGSDCEVKR
jgi:hypothetical protein